MQLSTYMARNKLTDEDVAKAIGCHRVTVSRLRRGVARPYWATAQAIFEFTGGKVSADDWLEKAA